MQLGVCHVLRGLGHPLQDIPQAAGVKNSGSGQLLRVSTSWILGQVADFTHHLNRALGGLTISRDDFGQGSFAGSVATNQANLVALLNPKVHTRHQGSGANADL